eukprot:2380668-Rhodomonas_salina.6
MLCWQFSRDHPLLTTRAGFGPFDSTLHGTPFMNGFMCLPMGDDRDLLNSMANHDGTRVHSSAMS